MHAAEGALPRALLQFPSAESPSLLFLHFPSIKNPSLPPQPFCISHQPSPSTPPQTFHISHEPRVFRPFPHLPRWSESTLPWLDIRLRPRRGPGWVPGKRRKASEPSRSCVCKRQQEQAWLPSPLLPPCGRLGGLMRGGPSESSGEPGAGGLDIRACGEESQAEERCPPTPWSPGQPPLPPFPEQPREDRPPLQCPRPRGCAKPRLLRGAPPEPWLAAGLLPQSRSHCPGPQEEHGREGGVGGTPREWEPKLQ